jgi:hypothetical protein
VAQGREVLGACQGGEADRAYGWRLRTPANDQATHASPRSPLREDGRAAYVQQGRGTKLVVNAGCERGVKRAADMGWRNLCHHSSE